MFLRRLVPRRFLVHNEGNMRVAVCFALVASAVGANAFVQFDDFSTSQSAVVLSGLGSASNIVAVGPFSRKQKLTVVAYNDPDGFERAYSRVANGYWIGSSDVEVQGVWSMLYGTPAAYFGLPNIFAVDFGSIDQNAVLQVTWTSGSAVATGQANVSAGSSVQTVYVSPTSVGAGFDWSNVSSVEFLILGPSGLDFKVDRIQTEAVPEPASLLAVGLGGLALMRRRRKA